MGTTDATKEITNVNDYLRWSKEHYENFTVGSVLLPRHLRRPVALLYAYCRYVDDLGDEAPGDRLALLEAFHHDVERCYTATPKHPLLQALQPVIERYRLPKDQLTALIEANRMDQTVSRYATYDDLLHYCEHSANPVGRLFLALCGYSDARRQALSDATCTALQLVNFLQDIDEDYRKGRIYLPEEDMLRFGVNEQMIADRAATPELRALLEFEADRAYALFEEGLPLTDLVEGIVKVDIRLFTYGGLAALDELKAVRYNVFDKRPTVTKWRKVRLFLRALRWLLSPARSAHTKGEYR